MSRKILVADLLCGAGGSSTGCARALAELGLEMELVCVNHWPIAIETHTRNHPEARHYCQDISTVRPHQVVPEGYLDLLMASPTCTHHSVARGGKPTSDQQRSDPWHINTWLTELRVKRILIENVWEFIGWGPVDPRTGKPIKSRKGEYFRAWTDSIRRLGFELEWRKLNAADYGDATTRQRFIMIGRSDGKSISWPTPTHHRKAENELFFPGVKPWRAAREIIDWNIKGRSIFDRKKALAPKTLARIYAGAVKFKWPEPFLVVLRNHMAGQSVDGPLPTIAANGTHIGLAQPILVNMKGQSTAMDVGAPVPTLTAGSGHVYVAEPLILNRNSAPRGETRPVSEPAPTPTTSGGGYLVEPFVVTVAHGNEAHEASPNGRRAQSVDDPLGAIHAGGGKYAVAEPFVLSRHGDGAPRSMDEPTPTQVAKHSHCLITSYYGMSETPQTADNPLPTVTTKDRFGIVVPVTHSQGGNAARNVDEPLPTMTTAKGGEFAMVMPVTHADGSDRARDAGEPLPTVTGANRGELAFITAQHGERDGQSPRVHAIYNPAPTIAASGHVDLIEGTATYDILFRMLEPHELAAAMGFDGDDAKYEFAGTKTEKIKQIGNAVSVAKMKACVGAIMADAVKPARALVRERRRARA